MRQLTEKKLKQIINEAVQNVLKESRSYSTDVEKWNYWCTNFTPDFIEEAWADDPNMIRHLKNKFNRCYELAGSYGAMTAFYLELDEENRIILENYVTNNF
jgi:hypothetical protein